MVVQNYLMSEQIGGASRGRRKQKRAELRADEAVKNCGYDDWKEAGWDSAEKREEQGVPFEFYTSINQAFACGEILGNKFSLGEMPLGSFIKMTKGEQKDEGIFKIKSYNNSTGEMVCQSQSGVGEVLIDASDNAIWYGNSNPSLMPAKI